MPSKRETSTLKLIKDPKNKITAKGVEHTLKNGKKELIVSLKGLSEMPEIKKASTPPKALKN